MRKRDRLQNWLGGSKSRASSPLPPANAITLTLTVNSSARVPSLNTNQNQALQRAIEEHIATIPDWEKDAFRSAAQQMTDDSVLEQVHSYDQNHRDGSFLRRRSESLSRMLNLLSRFTDAIAIGIQANPDVSSIIVGAARGIITMAIGFVGFFDKLSEMMGRMADYLGPLTAYAKSVGESKLVEDCLVNVYIVLLKFFRSARGVFVDSQNNARKWTSWRLFWRVQWLPFEEEFGTIEIHMRHHREVLSHAAEALNLDKSFEGSRNELARRQRELVREREDFLKWLSSYPFEEVHVRTFAKKHPGTGDWLLRRPEFDRWYTAQDSAVLWCYGKPGAGKSVLASNVIEHISSRCALDVHVGIAFAYYNYQANEMQEAFVISALIKQICRQNHSVPEGFLRVKNDALPPSQLGNVDSFLKAVEHYKLSKVFLVIDALDECPKFHRPAILKSLRDIVNRAAHVKVFVTSRPETDIEEAFTQMTAPRITIEAHNVQDDIHCYVTEEIRRLRQGFDGRKLNLNNPALEDQIIKRLTATAEGMFLWVNLQLIHLCEESESYNDRDVERALNTLPDGLDATYQRSLNHICQQNVRRQRLAFQTFRWVMYADRPLTVKELQHALAAEESGGRDCDAQITDWKFLLSACANLLEVVPPGSEDGTVGLIHYSVQEFITTNSDPRLQGQLLSAQHELDQIHAALATTCITYLMANLANLAPCKKTYMLMMRLEQCAFLWYAARSFDIHLVQSANTTALITLAEHLLQQPSKLLASMLQARAVRPYSGFPHFPIIYDDFNSFDRTVDSVMVIFSSRLYDIAEFRSHWKDRELNPLLLHAACSAGLTQAVAHLLKAGIAVNSADDNGVSAIYSAAVSGHIEAIRVLLDAGAELNTQCGVYGNALQAASVGSYEQIVQLLIEKGADVNAQGGYYGDALQAASIEGYEQIVRLLIERGADVNAQGGHYGSALQAASAGGYEQVVKMLLDAGAR